LERRGKRGDAEGEGEREEITEGAEGTGKEK